MVQIHTSHKSDHTEIAASYHLLIIICIVNLTNRFQEDELAIVYQLRNDLEW